MEGPGDNLNWFGEGFDDFPKRLPDDCIEYTIQIVDPKLQDAAIRTRLREVQKAATELTKRLLKEYIWQREAFRLEIVRDKGCSFLRGRTNYGDSVEDEWLIVYLLRELSRKFSDLWIKTVDADGEFLLIEAANALPTWLNPENADNRVWLHDGNLLIIPLQQPDTALKAAPLPPSVTSEESRRFLADHANELLHSPNIQSEAFYRIRNFPGQINDSMHHALTTVPKKVAHILHQNAAYISPATEAFYLRDPVALKPLQTENAEELVFPPGDFVTVSLKFTKVGYAQLKSQRFSAPPIWNSKLPSDQGAKDYARAEMGMKVTCGMEMLVRDPQSQDKASVREIKMLLEDLRSGDDVLPGHDEIMKWDDKDDEDKWLDIDFEEFERELEGKARGESKTINGHFGEKSTQENLRKMVERFKDFLNNDAAGAEGAEIPNSMDFDDDENSESDNSSEGEEKAVSFDENEFARMMREMMGIPADEQDGSLPTATRRQDISRTKATETDDADSNEGEGIRNVMQQMEAELNEAGALDLYPTPRKIAAKRTALKVKEAEESVASSMGEDGEHHEQEVNIDFDLVKNLLDSYKSQAGMAGPGGNLLGLMGIQLPPDADEDTLR